MKGFFGKIINEPLVKFFFLGGILYFVYTNTVIFLTKDEVKVTAADLINYMQFQANDFRKESYETKYKNLSETEKKHLLRQFTEEEILVREAQKMNLERDDYVIRKRLLQKMNFILSEQGVDSGEASDVELENYYLENTERYAKNEQFTFSHVFSGFENKKEGEAENIIQEFIDRSKKQFITPENAIEASDRFPYSNHYVQRSYEFIASQFGNDFTEIIKKREPNKALWQGPFRSDLGFHAICFIAKEQTAILPFEQVKEIVKVDYLSELKKAKLAKSKAEIMVKYKVVFNEK